MTTAPEPPTLEQLLNLIARAERKGGLNHTEGARLREGLSALAAQQPDGTIPAALDNTADMAELRRKYEATRKREWRWRKRAEATDNADAPADQEARDALRRVTALAQRWTYIPAKRQAGAAILATITNRDTDD